MLELTWQGQSSYCSLKVSTHEFSHPWSLLHPIMHDPKSILFSFWHASKLSLFWGVGFSPQTHIGFGQSEQPFGQFILHGQSKRTLGTFISKFSHIPNEQEVRALAHSVRQFELEHELAQSTYSSSHKPSHLSPISWSLKNSRLRPQKFRQKYIVNTDGQVFGKTESNKSALVKANNNNNILFLIIVFNKSEIYNHYKTYEIFPIRQTHP